MSPTNPTSLKMNAELKAKWVAALRSGEYQQGAHYFERDGRFCCLGVLCIAADQPTLVSKGTMGNWRFAAEQVGHHDTTLAAMNDSGDFSFSQIADYIEQSL